jgi:hypothetical protein
MTVTITGLSTSGAACQRPFADQLAVFAGHARTDG